MVTTEALESRPPRVESLTGLRWWAAFGVFAHHMTNLAPLPIYGQLSFGTYGVTFFFLLSGFVLTWSSSPDVTPVTFWIRRWARIYPAAFVALILAVLVFYRLTPDPDVWWQKQFDPVLLLLSVFLIQGWWANPVVLFSGNPAAWTLSCEAFFYALHPGLNRLLVRVRARGALVVAGGVFVVALVYRIVVVVPPGPMVELLPAPVTHLIEFALGMCLAWALRSGWRPRLPVWSAYLGSAVVLLGLMAARHYAKASGPVSLLADFTNEIVIVICAVLVVSVASRDIRGGRSRLRGRVLVTLGELSYSFYLVHATAIYFLLGVLGRQFPISWSNLVWYALLLGMSTGLAAGLHYGIERPLERRIRRWWDARRVRRRAVVVGASGGIG